MREIKFRAWDKDNKKMYEVIMLNTAYYKPSWQAIYFVNGGYRHASECEVMQYTGLKDKNGKEIYEGDIVKGLFADKQTINNGVISFMGCDYIVKFSEDSAKGFYYLHHMFCDTVEVIGNIYENPEFLKE